MSRFVIIRDTLNNSSDVLDVFKTLVGHNVELYENNNCVIAKYGYDNQNDVHDLLISFINENMVSLTCYISSLQPSAIDDEIAIGLSLINKLPIGVYNLKEALLNSRGIDNCKEILDVILYSSGIDVEFVRQFVSYDLNISKASKCMYIHRNTLNYKLDKLYELSGFDLRVFLDSYIIYNLIQNR